MDREKWLAERRKGIGGSDIAGIVGESPWATPLSVFMDKMGMTEYLPPTKEQRRGLVLEEYVAEMYRDETGYLTEDPMSREYELIKGRNPIVIGTPDRRVFQPFPYSFIKGLEVKTSRNDKGWGEAGTDQVPLYYSLQCHWYLILFPDFQEWDLAALLGIDDFRIYTIKRDVELEGLLVEKAEKFWRDHIETGIPPDLTRANPYQVKDYLKAKYQSHDTEMIEADVHSEVNACLRLLELMDLKLEGSKSEIEIVKNKIKEYIGNHAGIESQEFKATWKQTKPTENIDWEQVAKTLAKNANLQEKYFKELIDKFTTKKPGPRKFLWAHKQQEIEHDSSRRQITSKSE